MHVTVTYPRLALLALGLLLAGALAAEAPSLYYDLRFLHIARLVNEQAVADAQAKAAQQQAHPAVERIDQSQVHPGIVPPNESPPKGK